MDPNCEPNSDLQPQHQHHLQPWLLSIFPAICLLFSFVFTACLHRRWIREISSRCQWPKLNLDLELLSLKFRRDILPGARRGGGYMYARLGTGTGTGTAFGGVPGEDGGVDREMETDMDMDMERVDMLSNGLESTRLNTIDEESNRTSTSSVEYDTQDEDDHNKDDKPINVNVNVNINANGDTDTDINASLAKYFDPETSLLYSDVLDPASSLQRAGSTGGSNGVEDLNGGNEDDDRHSSGPGLEDDDDNDNVLALWIRGFVDVVVRRFEGLHEL